MSGKTDNTGKHSKHDATSRGKAGASTAERTKDSDSDQSDLQAQQDKHGKEDAAARDDSKTIAREKDTSRTAALRK